MILNVVADSSWLMGARCIPGDSWRRPGRQYAGQGRIGCRKAAIGLLGNKRLVGQVGPQFNLAQLQHRGVHAAGIFVLSLVNEHAVDEGEV